VARVLLASSPEKGHVNPMVGVAQWLRRLGHTVGWLCIPAVPAQVRGLDVEAFGLPPGTPVPDLHTEGPELARLVRDPDALAGWIRTLLLDAVPAHVEPVRGVVRAFEPDVVATDGMLYQVVIASRLEGVPFAGLSSALTLFEPRGFDSDLLRTVRALKPARGALFASHGLEQEFRTCEALSPVLNVVFATRDLVGDEEPPPQVLLAGPSRPLGARGDEAPFPWEVLDGRPLVYASFGSQVTHQPAAYEAIAAAAHAVGAQLVLSAGELAGTPWARTLPGPPVVAPYVPQRRLLPRADAFVSHGGANSVLESLDAGVPLVLVPVCNDQPLQAFFVERAGAGVVVDRDGLDEGSCRQALQRVLGDGSCRQAAGHIAAAWSATDGAREAASRIGALA
jgi:zeaxanthin glucosyltransferase